jgi:hypothetical protein
LAALQAGDADAALQARGEVEHASPLVMRLLMEVEPAYRAAINRRIAGKPVDKCTVTLF